MIKHNCYYFLLVTIFSILVSIIIFLNVVNQENVSFAGYKEDLYQNNVKNSVQRYEYLIKEYRIKETMVNDRYITIYDDDFGGIYIDENGFLNIGLILKDKF